ncbi:MAG TPA: ferritin-like fold-containing protein [Phycicoccus sp.]|nr:ferritin-like fold-containing protein [Phycicoccus sp.]
MDQTALGESEYRAAVSDLLGVLAYGELTAFLRMAVDSDLAPTLSLKSQMAGLANTEYVQYTLLVDHMRALGIDPEAAMQPFVAPFASFHERTRPKGWLEGLVKAYVGDGIAKDFYREVSSFVDEETREVMNAALDDQGQADFVVQIVRDALRTDPTAAGRLALWGRRLMGEALSQAQAVAVERDALSALLIGGGVDLAEVGRMFTRLTENHQRRMTRLGLAA